ncbi:hypothetical protein FB008_12652 [Sinorhizobium medicae]|nr:hypothetical protein FB008_12652 [Sinorhizobium medicae]
MKVASGAGVLTVRVSTQFWRELPSAESSRPSYRGSHNARPCLALTCKHQFVSAPRWRHLKQAGTEIPVVFMTAIEDEALEREAVAAGCIAYLRKPFRAEPLLTASSARSHSPRATSIAWLASSRLPQRTIERLADSRTRSFSLFRQPAPPNGQGQAAFREHRRRDQRDQRIARQAFRRRTGGLPRRCGRARVPPSALGIPAGLPRRNGGDYRRQWLHQHCRAAVRRWRPSWRGRCPRYGGHAHRTRRVIFRRGLARLSGAAWAAVKPAGPQATTASTFSFQRPRALCPGIRAGRPWVQRAGGGPAHLEQHRSGDRRCIGRYRSCLRAHGPRLAACRAWSAAAGTFGLVSNLPRLSSLLSEPAQSFASLLGVRRRFPA